MPQANHYDGIIIGSGAGAGTLAYALAPTAKPVSNEPRIQQLQEDLARLGCRPFHVPLGVLVADHLRERLG